MLVGHWRGRFVATYGLQDAHFFEDASCEWTNTEESGGIEKVDNYSGWLWTVSGANRLPEFDAPWIMQLHAGENATAPVWGGEPNLSGKTVRIVAIDQQGFTAYNEGAVDDQPIFLEMERVP